MEAESVEPEFGEGESEFGGPEFGEGKPDSGELEFGEGVPESDGSPQPVAVIRQMIAARIDPFHTLAIEVVNVFGTVLPEQAIPRIHEPDNTHAPEVGIRPAASVIVNIRVRQPYGVSRFVTGDVSQFAVGEIAVAVIKLDVPVVASMSSVAVYACGESIVAG